MRSTRSSSRWSRRTYQSEYQALMANGVKASQQFGLNVGTALTDAQMAALTSDIV
ncbi:hypothetical protein [Burkholderia anthina]|uniref:hypothetical protein n=1 Tax=Burkholderia anthina TaxID=179879 RepID=UPI000A6C9206|nr:hypothetical protein [Burkholderia anthina]